MEGSTNPDHVIGIPVNSTAYGIEEPDFPEEETISAPDHAGFVGASFQSAAHDDVNSSTATDHHTSQPRRKGGKIAQGIIEHGNYSSLLAQFNTEEQ
jgi:hypothetical protein